MLRNPKRLIQAKNQILNIKSNKNIKKFRLAILTSLKSQGFKISNRSRKNNSEIIPPSTNKDVIRSLHNHARIAKLMNNAKFLQTYLSELSTFFANGDDINLNAFDPRILPVQAETEGSRLFRLASLLWSVPVSQGFGRRTRFLILDQANNKLVGLFALGDPVFNLRARDQLIGWNHHQRARRLYHLMDIFVLGSVPPYSDLLCGKLVAMLAASNEVRKVIYKKYKGKKSHILGEAKNPYIVLLTTGSALGRSSLYNRITYNGRIFYQSIGETQGWGHFHIADETFMLMRDFLKVIDHPIAYSNRFGQGPNWKMRLIRICLERLKLSPALLRHGIRREVYIVPLAENYRAFLSGEEDFISFYDMPASKIVEFFKERWFFPRARRVDRYRYIKANDTLNILRKFAPNVKGGIYG